MSTAILTKSQLELEPKSQPALQPATDPKELVAFGYIETLIDGTERFVRLDVTRREIAEKVKRNIAIVYDCNGRPQRDKGIRWEYYPLNELESIATTEALRGWFREWLHDGPKGGRVA